MSDNNPTTPESPPTTPDPALDQEELAKKWLAEIDSAYKRERKWRQDAQQFIKIYEGDEEDVPFNILYSNTDTLSPALYNEVPRPLVKPRYKDTKNPLIPHAARVGQRLLEFFVDNGDAAYPSFDTLMKSSVLSALVPGRGSTLFAYDAETENAEPAAGSTDTPPAEPLQRVTYENVCGKAIAWNDMLHGYGKVWRDVQWVAFGIAMTKEELEENFPGKATQVQITDEPDDIDPDEPGKSRNGAGADSAKVGIKTCQVWQIWDKVHRKVISVTRNNAKIVLKEIDDPLELEGFFPCPEPLRLMAKVTNLLPTPLYKLYRQQAKELNITTVRIKKLTEALKVRGYYDVTLDKVKEMLTADDNTLQPVDLMAIFGQGRSADSVIWLYPLDKLVGVLNQLTAQRQQIKAVIFEITGIADIMRGASQASETLGAQELKNQWGTLRLKRMQKAVAGYARDCLRLMLEIGVSKLGQDTIIKMTGLQYPTDAEKQQLQQQLQQMQAAQAEAQQKAQAGIYPPEQFAKAQEQAAPAFAQIQEQLAQPSWEAIIKMLRDDTLRSFNIDIETNSTVDIEATEDKKDLAELLNAVSQFMSGVAPLIESKTMPFEVAQGMLITILRRFRLGDDVEDLLKKMQPPQADDDGKKEEMQAKLQMEQEKHKAAMESDQAKMAQEKELAQMGMAMKQQEHQMKMKELGRKEQMDQAKFQMEMMKLKATTEATMATAAMGVQQGQQQLDQQGQKFEMEAAHSETMNKQNQDAAVAQNKIKQQQAKQQPKPQGRK